MVLDVGANVGTHALAFAEMVGPGGQVIAVEGQPAAFTLLAHNIVANGLADVIVALPVLAGAGERSVRFRTAPVGDNVGAKTFVPEMRGSPPPPGKGLDIPLSVATLDGLGLEACALIKIDVEGMELDVLRGGTTLLRTLQPVIYFEHVSGNTESMTAIFDLLCGTGYRLYWHVANPFNNENFKGYTVNIFGGNLETNILALHGDRVAPSGLPEILDPARLPPIPSLADGLPGVAVYAGSAGTAPTTVRSQGLQGRLLKLLPFRR